MKTKIRSLASVLCLLMVILCVVGMISCTEEKECAHDWSDWSITQKATCTEEGTKARECSICGEAEKSTVAALGHDWNEATCSSPKTCKNCSATEGEALAHSYTVEAVTNEALKSPATCESAAVYYKSCACGEISKEDTFTSGATASHTDAVDDGDHDCDACGKADVSEHSYDGSTCSDCGDVKKSDHTHLYDQSTVNDQTKKSDATCESAAVYYKSCSCGDISETDTFTSGAPLEHKDNNKDHVCDNGCNEIIEECSDADGDDDHDCDLCGKADVTSHDYGDATCGSPATCEECGETKGTSSPHIYNQNVVRNDTLKSAADCESAAVYYKSCSCGDISKTDTFTSGDPLGHKDENTDHICDNKCGKDNVGTHADSDKDKDHLCDYGCGEVLESCSDAEGDDDHNCDVCSKADITAHDYGDATCGSPATCEECGETKGSASPHIYNQSVVKDSALKSAATCTSAAVYYKSCSCGEVSNSSLETFTSGDPLPHVHNKEIANADTLKSAATCTSAAVYYKSCACGHISESEIFTSGTAVAHSYDKEIVNTDTLKSEADCKNAAVYYKSCVCGDISDTDTFIFGRAADHKDENTDHSCDYDCGKDDMGEHADSDTDNDHLCDHGCGEVLESCSDAEGDDDHNCDVCAKADITAHDYGDATCGSPATCEECGETKGTASPHIYNQEIVSDEAKKSDATCTSAAVYYKSCSCGDISTNDIETFTVGSTLPHTYSDEIVSDEAKKSDATCTDLAVYYKSCECGAISEKDADTFTSGELADHEHNQLIVKDAAKKSDATCTSAAIYYKSCQCGHISESDIETFTNGTTIAHSYAPVESTPATCTSPATITYRCSCNDSYTEESGGKLGHDISGVKATERKVSDCGYILVYECQRGDCHAEVLGETIYKHNHIASITTPATCKDDGVKTLTCACGDTKTEKIEKDATGHNWVKGEATDGTRTDECSHCGETKIVAVYDGNNTGSTNAGDLANTEIELNDANITLDNGVIDSIGSDKNVTVSADKLEGDDRNELGLTDKQLEQVGNNPIYNFTINDGEQNISQFGKDNYVTITLPYTLKDGEDVDSIAIWFISDHCEVEDCPNGDECSDNDHKLVSMLATYNNGYVTFKTNHFSYYTVTNLDPSERCALYGHGYVCQHVEGDCTTDSYDLYVCVRCHDKYIDEETYVKATGHDYTVETHDATCTQSGYVLYTCDCGHSYRTKINAKGHSFGVIDSQEASCVSNGYTKYGCGNCDAEYTVKSDKLAHVYTTTTVPATCEEYGYTLHACDNCAHSYSNEFVAPLGHSFNRAWEWSSDYKEATLTLVCENDEEHAHELDAKVGINLITSAACSNYSKTTYKAAVSFGGRIYTDEKTVEIGSLNHEFADEWSYDGLSHWHECACGAKKDEEDHEFGAPSHVKDPTCGEAGESISYCDCGKEKTTVIPATGDHNFVDDVCTECGKTFVDTYYINLINSWKTINGFAIKIEDLSFELKRIDPNIVDAFELIGKIKQVDIAELSLYVEDGEIGGAATGSLVIYNGPIANASAPYSFKAVIHDGFAYISIDAAGKKTSMKISVDDVVASLLDNMDINEETQPTLDFINDTLLPAIDTLVELNSDSVNSTLENAFNIVFTFEEQEDGSFVATLDYDKLYALNERLATMTVSEVIDLYFGEGSFDSVVDFILEVLDLELSEIPEFVDDLGLDSADLIEKINELARKSGAPNDYDIEAFLKDMSYNGVTVGMLLFGTEDNSYLDLINDSTQMLRENSLYELIAPEESDSVKQAIDSIIDLISNNISVSFTTDSAGTLSSVRVCVDNFTYQQDETELSLNFTLDVIINGRIDVTWMDIVEEIESEIVSPSEDMLEDDMYINYNPGYAGTITYQGMVYEYSNGIKFYAYQPMFDKIGYYIASPDCGDWMMYQIGYASIGYRFTLIGLNLEEGFVLFLVDDYSGEVANIVFSENGFTAIFDDGSEKTFEMDLSGDNSEQIYTNIYLATFGSAQGKVYLFNTEIYFCYNGKTNEYADKSQHSLNSEYELLGECCREDGCRVHTSCENCDYSSTVTVYECDWEYDVEINLSECGSVAYANICNRCGDIGSVRGIRYDCDFEIDSSESILDEYGNIIGETTTEVCTNCGLTCVESSWTEHLSPCEEENHLETTIYKDGEEIFSFKYGYLNSSHDYVYNYELLGQTCDDGYVESAFCTKCGDNYSYTNYGHSNRWEQTDLSKYGLCGGYIEKNYCTVCNTVFNYYVDSWCDWEHVADYEDGSSEYSCRNCQATRISHTESGEKYEECLREYTQTHVYFVNGEEVCRSTDSYFAHDHNYETSYELNGELCTEGWTIYNTCTDCDDTFSYSGEDHIYFVLFETDENTDCCKEHEIHVSKCLCEQNKYAYFNYDSFTFNEETQIYECENCLLTVSKPVVYEEYGCEMEETKYFIVKLGDHELYSQVETNSRPNHSFTDVSASVIDGITTITSKCDECGEEKVIEVLVAELEEYYDEENGTVYYYDYYFTPDKSAIYTIIGLGDGDTKVELYKIVDGDLVEMDSDDDSMGYYGQFLLNSSLTEGETYVYRIRYFGWENEGDIEFAIFENTLGTVCSHSHEYWDDFYALGEGSENCEDGLINGKIHSTCGCITGLTTIYDHYQFSKEYIDLQDHGACYGYYALDGCLCGRYIDLYGYSCADKWTNDEYEEDGKWIYVSTATCSSCSLRCTTSYYEEKVADSCTILTHYTVTISIGDELIFDIEYTKTYMVHDMVSSGVLHGTSCEDGVTITQRCKFCDYEETYDTRDHVNFEKQRIELSGSECGGYAVEYGCVCGFFSYINIEHSLCELDSRWCDLWIENTITDEQYLIDGHFGPHYGSYIYTCAVTDPERCAYKIRYASYWLKAEGECYIEQYQTWQFGYNEETGECDREITLKTGTRHAYHNYTEVTTNNSHRFDCADCSSYYYENYYYNENGNCIKYEQLIYNALNDGNDRYCERIFEYATDDNNNRYTSREYYKYIYSDGSEYWEETLISQSSYNGSFGEGGYTETKNFSNSNGNSYTEIRSYVWYMDYEYIVYFENTEADYWHKCEYVYSFDGTCIRTTYYSDSNGNEHSEDNSCCNYTHETIKNPTCTQDGLAGRHCVICGLIEDSYSIPAHDHNWAQIYDNLYHCIDCGLENANGASGSIVMEDLTEQYGNGEYYVVGYYALTDVEFDYYVSLILEDRREIIVQGVQFTTIDGLRAVAFSKAEVDAWAEENGYTDYDVRFSFVPYGNDSNFDYGITFTEATVDTSQISTNISFVDYIGEGEIMRYTITPTEDGIWVFASFTTGDTFAELYDSEGSILAWDDDGGYNANFYFSCELEAGKTYTLEVRWLDVSISGNAALVFYKIPA